LHDRTGHGKLGVAPMPGNVATFTSGCQVARAGIFGLCCALAAACDGSALGPAGSSPDAGPGSSSDAGAPAGPGRWESLAPMTSTPRYYVGVAAVGERVFVVGGVAAGNPGASMEVTAYNTRSAQWETISPLPAPFYMLNVAGVAGKLYVLGGRDVKTALAYDVAAKKWETLAPVPVERGRGQSAVGVWGSKILLAGGVIPGQSANNLNTGVRQSDVLAYDTISGGWEELPRLALTRGYCMGAVIGSRFWVMGGSSDFVRTDDVTVLDLATNTWEDQPALPITLSSAGAAVLNGRVYLVGGIASGTGMIGPATFYLDPAGGSFEQAAVMLTPRFATGAATVDGKIYVPTGIAEGAMANTFAPVPALEVFTP
jgi:hypothetical protein